VSTREGPTAVEHATCLGCGCACDDIRVVVQGNRIVEAERACPLGAAWFGDGVVPQKTSVSGRPVDLQTAFDTAAALLVGAERPLVYIATELSCEAQRAAVAIADMLTAALDSTSSSVAQGTLAAQRRGRASATLGELRNRADLVVFWGVDPMERYPRFAERYAPEPVGTHVPRGRADRTVIAVDVGEVAAYGDADLRLRFAGAVEEGALSVMRATVLRSTVAGRTTGRDPAAGEWEEQAAVLARRMTQARYVGIVYDAEQETGPGRTEALIALAQALNGPTRCALIGLRGGGNRSGSDAVLTWQTGFPIAVDFARGTPRYAAGENRPGLPGEPAHDVMLLLGDPAGIAAPIARALAPASCIAVGPFASELAPTPAVAIDTGIAGIHGGGLALRMDDVPLPLRPSVQGPPDATSVVLALSGRVQQLLREHGGGVRADRAGRPVGPGRAGGVAERAR
jgi:formylmethanofuran dehydrogenase subunit B